MKRFRFSIGFLIATAWCPLAVAAPPIFSGPQVGEKLPAFMVKGVYGDAAGKDLDVITEAAGKPVLLMFVHERTRPVLGLTNVIATYADTRKADGLHTEVIFLTDDATATEQWMNIVKKNLTSGVSYGLSKHGKEGPGAYGLNRNVALTVLVGREGKVTANFALIQPSEQADGPRILQAIVDVAGGTAPPISELRGNGGGRMEMKRPAGREEDDQELRSLVRSVISREATPDDVKAAAAKVNEYVAGREKAQRQLGQMTKAVVESGKLGDYGTAPAQAAVSGWAKKYGETK